MRHLLRPLIILLLGLLLLGGLVLLLSPAARRLAPLYLYYDLVGRRVAPLPPAAEHYVFTAGQEFCAIGRDTACGGYRIISARRLAVGPEAQRAGVGAAWCVDYQVLRRNTGALTGNVLLWAGIPRAMVLTEHTGRYEGYRVEGCSGAAVP